MDPAAAAAAEEEGREKPPVIYTMENKPIVTCECAPRPQTGVNGRCRVDGRGRGGIAMAAWSGAGGPGRCLPRGPGRGPAVEPAAGGPPRRWSPGAVQGADSRGRQEPFWRGTAAEMLGWPQLWVPALGTEER